MITAPRSAAPVALLRRVREREMPGLKLTKPQATRLFGVVPSVCATMLGALVRENFLSRTEEGAFVRADQTLNERAHSDGVHGALDLVGESRV